MRIAIIGSGNVGTALGAAATKAGHEVTLSASEAGSAREAAGKVGAKAADSNADAVRDAEIVVLAVPGLAVSGIADELGSGLDGKVVVDSTNPINETFDDLFTTGRSSAEELQDKVPNAKVVKAFNTLNWTKMVDPQSSGGPVSIPIVGDDATARAAVAEIVKGMGLEPVDLGPLRFANTLEEMLVIWANARSHGAAYNYHLRPEPASAPAR